MPLFSEDEMLKAIKAMKNGKAPGPDGIPAYVLKRGYHQSCQKISSIQRQAALRIASAYHTVSLAAIQVIASVIPIDLLALERKYIYDSVDEREVASTHARYNSMNEWEVR